MAVLVPCGIIVWTASPVGVTGTVSQCGTGFAVRTVVW